MSMSCCCFCFVTDQVPSWSSMAVVMMSIALVCSTAITRHMVASIQV